MSYRIDSSPPVGKSNSPVYCLKFGSNEGELIWSHLLSLMTSQPQSPSQTKAEGTMNGSSAVASSHNGPQSSDDVADQGDVVTGVAVVGHSERCFRVFPELPIELQREIWRDAHRAEEPRIVEITYDIAVRGIVCLTPSPPLLLACHESRNELIRKYATLSTPHPGSSIYINLSYDILFIREDKHGIKSNNGTLLRAIFGDTWLNPIVDLSAVRNLAIDFWVMNRAWFNLSALRRLRSVRNICVVMADLCSPGTYNLTRSQKAPTIRPIFLHNLVNVGFKRQDIESALTRYWGISPTAPGFTVQADGIQDLVLSYIPSEIYTLQLWDNSWWMPPFDFVALDRQ